jgi:hypothetical protein
MVDAGRNMDHGSGGYLSPFLGAGIDHLLTFTLEDIEDLLFVGMVVTLMPFADLDGHYAGGHPLGSRNARLTHPLNASPIENLPLDMLRLDKPSSC